MTDPFTVITLSYGRVHHLSEAIQSFLIQDYAGPKEMIVYNTLDAQVLKGEFPNVRFVNAPRPASLGATRNAAIELAPDDSWIFGLDDDDLWLKSHLSTYVPHLEGNDWLWLDRQYYAQGRSIRSMVAGSCPIFAFRKRIWKEVGGYASRDCGEDREFIGRITTRFPGKRVHVSPEQITFIYSWADGGFHLSGEGDDIPGRPSGHQRIEQWTMDGVRSGRIPSGEIIVQPAWQNDYEAQAKRFLEASFPDGSKKNDCCIVLLGRFGDIINALPIAKHVHDNYAKPAWLVSKEFASIFDGVSYVAPYVLDLHHTRLEDAMKVARRDFKHVLQAQVYGGPQYPQERVTKSFNMESWRNVGFLHKFKAPDWMPLFDVRSFDREFMLMASVNPSYRPMIVFNGISASSPYEHAKALREAVFETFGEKFLILDLTTIVATRLYDLLALLDRADALVSVDTATLHLSAASTVPHVFAITNPRPWLGSVLRRPCNRFSYETPITEIVSKMKETLI